MTFMLQQNCKCCQFFMDRSGIETYKLDSVKNIEHFKKVMHHCEDCWNKWHHGERDKDFEELANK